MCTYVHYYRAPTTTNNHSSTTKLLELELILPSFSLSFPVLHLPWPPSEERNPHEFVVAQVFRPLRGRLRQLLDGRRCRVYKTKAPVARPTKEVWTGSRRELFSSIWRHWCWEPTRTNRPKEENGRAQRSFHATVRPHQYVLHIKDLG